MALNSIPNALCSTLLSDLPPTKTATRNGLRVLKKRLDRTKETPQRKIDFGLLKRLNPKERV